MTRAGLEALEKELEELKTVRRKDVAEKIKVARGFGDLSENSEYDEAKNEQGFIESRIAQLEAMLKHARVIDNDDLSLEHVSVGTHVKIEDEDGEGIQAIANGLRIADYRLSSRDYLLKGQSIPGFTGELTLKCRLDGFHLTMANLLLHFAPYAGVGIKTALGMGGVTCE